MREYVQEAFGFEYESFEDLNRLVDQSEMMELADTIRPIKKEEVLAVHDARQILAIYGKRLQLGEQHRPNLYGFRTWWLTHETRVGRLTGGLVRNRGSRYVMRPEFILNFIALSPSMEEVRRGYNSVFPSLLGVRLSGRMREEVFHDVIERAKDLAAVDEARARVMLGELATQLKGDQFKRYEIQWQEQRAKGAAEAKVL